MNAIILAAGGGGRLRDVTGGAPKCLIPIGGRSLLARQLSALDRCGVGEVAVVTGHAADEVRRACPPGVRFVHNARYASTNSLYSLWLARHLLEDGFVVLNCDVLFHEQLLVDLLTARYEDAVLVAGRAPGERYTDEEMKVRIRAGAAVAFAKTLDPDDADAENIGIAKFGAEGARLLADEATALVAAGGATQWLPAAFDRFCRRRPLRAIDHRGFPWIEIDVPEDYRRACTDILPALGTDAEADERSPHVRTVLQPARASLLAHARSQLPLPQPGTP